ncbi:hypothetical protein CKA32_006091 [Geitlerinema sp. FC II]|nr:hypothetical protein CKA32_006091 [Geitlerinema sp. FC II]
MLLERTGRAQTSTTPPQPGDTAIVLQAIDNSRSIPPDARECVGSLRR